MRKYIRSSTSLIALAAPFPLVITSAYPPTGDIRRPMSVIVLFSSTLPPTTDIPGPTLDFRF